MAPFGRAIFISQHFLPGFLKSSNGSPIFSWRRLMLRRESAISIGLNEGLAGLSKTSRLNPPVLILVADLVVLSKILASLQFDHDQRFKSLV